MVKNTIIVFRSELRKHRNAVISQVMQAANRHSYRLCFSLWGIKSITRAFNPGSKPSVRIQFDSIYKRMGKSFFVEPL